MSRPNIAAGYQGYQPDIEGISYTEYHELSPLMIIIIFYRFI